jgi:predicted porin
MKKSLLALAVLGLFAGAASAQSSVTLYGKVDVGGVLETGGPMGGARTVKVDSGISGGSRLGFKGSEDLGGGLRANFVAETGFCADSGGFCTGGGVFMGRQAWVGLSGGFGAVTMGRQYTPTFLLVTTVDPFGTGYAGQVSNLVDVGGTAVGNPRWSNSVEYATPSMGGFQVTAGAAAGEQTGNWKAGRQYDLSATYSAGPLFAGASYHQVNTATGGTGKKDYTLGAVYDLGMLKLHGMYERVKNGGASAVQSYDDADDIMVGTSVPMGQGTIMASFVRHNDKTAANLDANQIGVGYNYALSKRTSLYTAYAHISNKNGAFYTVGNASSAGTGNGAFNVGVVHNF